MRQLKIIVIFLTCFVVILLAAYSYDTSQRLQLLSAELNKFDRDISNLEVKYIENLGKYNLITSEISKLIQEYQKSSLGISQQEIFVKLVLEVNNIRHRRVDSLNYKNKNDILEGLINRRKLILTRRLDVNQRIENAKDSLVAKLLSY